MLLLAERIRPDGTRARSWAEPSADGTSLLVRRNEEDITGPEAAEGQAKPGGDSA